MDESDIRTVLVVEDDDLLLAAYMRRLRRRSDLRLLAAHDLSAGRAHAQHYRPHIALIDMMLPDGNGIQLIAEMRRADPRAVLVLVSGHNYTESTVEAMRAGATDVLNKPVPVDEVIDRRLGRPSESGKQQARPYTLDRLSWEHVRRVFRDAGYNKSETARQLGIDRNTLKRWLAMPPPVL